MRSARKGESAGRRSARYAMVGLFLLAGCGHLFRPAFFIQIVPAGWPRPDLLVAVSGLAELGLALGLVLPRTRRLAGLGLFLLILAVWPANWNMALNAQRFTSFAPWQLWLRVALQVPMLLWAVYAGGVWPPINRATVRS